jgi:heat shock protein HslJ
MEEHINTNWKKSMIVVALVLFGSTAFSFACGETDKREVMLSDIQDRVWKLMEVKNESATITISRTNAPTDIYTIEFETNRLVGSGAYNRFFSHYTVGEYTTLSLSDFLCELRSFSILTYQKFFALC